MNSRSVRQSFLGASSDAVFARAVVAINGLCGGGSHIAQQLAHVGLLHFLLFDPDYVDYPNLNRMVGSKPLDAKSKRLKAEVIRDLILQIQPEADVRVFATEWQTNHLAMRETSLVFGCVDSFGQRDQLEAYSRRFLLPYIDVGMDVHQLKGGGHTVTGQIITSIPGEPCMRCTGFITEGLIAREAERYGDAGDRPQVIWPNGVLASTAVGIGVSLLTPWTALSPCRFIEYDGNRHELRASRVLAAIPQTCPHYPVEEVGDPLWKPRAP